VPGSTRPVYRVKLRHHHGAIEWHHLGGRKGSGLISHFSYGGTGLATCGGAAFSLVHEFEGSCEQTPLSASGRRRYCFKPPDMNKFRLSLLELARPPLLSWRKKKKGKKRARCLRSQS